MPPPSHWLVTRLAQHHQLWRSMWGPEPAGGHGLAQGSLQDSAQGEPLANLPFVKPGGAFNPKCHRSALLTYELRLFLLRLSATGLWSGSPKMGVSPDGIITRQEHNAEHGGSRVQSLTDLIGILNLPSIYAESVTQGWPPPSRALQHALNWKHVGITGETSKAGNLRAAFIQPCIQLLAPLPYLNP